MAVEAASYISELVPANTGDTTDPIEGGAQIALIKTVLQNQFPNLNTAVNFTPAQANYLAGITAGTAAASKALTADASANVNAAALTWTSLGTVTTATFTAFVMSGVTINAIQDQDDMAADSATALPTQQSVKAYVDGKKEYVCISALIADVSTAETVLVPVPVAGTVVRMDTVLQGTISASDATVALKTAADAAMASLVISYSSSAAGDVDSATEITNATVAAGDYLKLSTDGASTGAQKLWASILIERAVH